MNKGVYTTYKTKGDTYASYIIGETIEEITHKLKLRGLNEIIVSQIQEIGISNKPNNKIDLIHDICFKSWMLLNAKLITLEDVLGDKGILHELIHEFENNNVVNDTNITTLLCEFKEKQKKIGF